MGVAAEVLEETLRPAEGALHVDEPGSTVEGAEGAACRHRVCGRQLATGKAALEGGQYLAANSAPRTRTGKRCRWRAGRQRRRSTVRPPAVTMQWTCGLFGWRRAADQL